MAAAGLAAALLFWGCGGEGGSSEPAPAQKREAASGAPETAPPLLGDGDRVVFFGDSLAVEAPPNYPQLLGDELGARARGIEVVNLAEPGTTAADWAPGSALWEQRLEPELADADLLVVTLGGNDLQEGLGGSDGIDSVSVSGAGSQGDAFSAIDRFERRLGRIFAAIRRRSPGAGIAYVGYPDYSRATVWREAGGLTGTLALEVGLEALVRAASDAGPDLLVDMRAPSGRAGVDSLLADSEHLNSAGHELYARRLARALTR